MRNIEHLLFTKTHEWVEIQDNNCFIGITAYAQDMLGDIVYVRLPEEGQETTTGEPFTDLESVKAVSDVYSPVDGEVTEVNMELDAAPELLNSSTYNAWIAKIYFNDIDKSNLMTLEQYNKYVEGLAE